MSTLTALAKAVCAATNPDQRELATRHLQDFFKDPDHISTSEQIERARAEYCADSNGDIQVDNDALASTSSYGVWVQAWVYLRNPE